MRLQNWFIEKFLKWQWIEVLEDARMMGDLPGVTSEDIKQVQFIPNGWKWIDPQKEALATKVALAIGVTTLQIECARQGLDWQEVKDQQLKEEAYDMKQRESLGLPPKVQDETEGEFIKTGDDQGEEGN